jgi:hypothetical protein
VKLLTEEILICFLFSEYVDEVDVLVMSLWADPFVVYSGRLEEETS